MKAFAEHSVHLRRGEGGFSARIDDGEWRQCSATQSANERTDRFTLKFEWEGRILDLSAFILDDQVTVFGEVSHCPRRKMSKMLNLASFQGGKTEFELVRTDFLATEADAATASDSNVKSPMTGVYNKVLVDVNQEVAADTPVAVITAMKMEYVLKSPRKGVVTSVNPKVGQNVAKGEIIVTIE